VGRDRDFQATIREWASPEVDLALACPSRSSSCRPAPEKEHVRPSSRRGRSYEGLTPVWPLQTGGMPVVPTGIFDQSSTRKRPAAKRRSRGQIRGRHTGDSGGSSLRPNTRVLTHSRVRHSRKRARPVVSSGGCRRIDDLLVPKAVGGSERLRTALRRRSISASRREIGAGRARGGRRTSDCPSRRQRARHPPAGVTARIEGLDGGVTGAATTNTRRTLMVTQGHVELIDRLERA